MLQKGGWVGLGFCFRLAKIKMVMSVTIFGSLFVIMNGSQEVVLTDLKSSSSVAEGGLGGLGFLFPFPASQK